MAGTNGKSGFKKVIINIMWGFSAELVWASGLLLYLAILCTIAWLIIR